MKETAEGFLLIRLENRFRAGKSSIIQQRIVFFKDSDRIDFETIVDWKENHKLLKVYRRIEVQKLYNSANRFKYLSISSN